MTEDAPRGSTVTAFAIMVLTPLFFSTNLIFGRGVVPEVASFTLAFIRWALVALCLAPFAWREREALAAIVAARPQKVLLLGFLGMWVCGAIVYLGLSTTSAINGTLIYTTSPLFILLIEAVFLAKPVSARQATGALVAFAGVAVIVTRGDWATLTGLDFVAGDLLILLAAICWAIYSVVYRDPVLTKASNMGLFALIASTGAVILLPFALYEASAGLPMPVTASAWGGIAGIVAFASLLAFSGFQFGLRKLGPSVTGIFMYLMPPYGVLLAILFLSEAFHAFHAAGIALVLGGVILATAPLGRRRQPSMPSAGKVSSNQ